jgi:hypothetical protein
VEIAPVPATARVEMVRLLRQAAVVVSFSDYESAGLAIREAVALRRPVLVREDIAHSALAGVRNLATVPVEATPTEIAGAIVHDLCDSTPVAPVGADETDDWVAAYELIYQEVWAPSRRFVTTAPPSVQTETDAERSGGACHSRPSASASAQPAE